MADLEFSLDLDTGPFEKKMKGLPDTAEGTAARIGKAWAAVSMAMGVKGVAAAADFEEKMAKIASLGTSKEGLARLRAGILAMPEELGRASDLAEAAYQSLSNDIAEGDVIRHITGSATLAKAGMTDLGDTTKALTGFVNAYGKESKSAAEISDIMAKAVDLGAIEIKDMVQALGDVAPIAAEAKISQEELLGAAAAITTKGVAGVEAMTRLRWVISSLVAPTASARKAAKQMGIEGFGAAFVKAHGLKGALDILREKTGGNVEKLQKLMHGSMALTGALTLNNEGGQKFAATLDKMRDHAGKAEFSMQEMAETTHGKFDKLSAAVDKLFIGIGERFLPPIEKAIDILVKQMDLLAKAAEIALLPVTMAVNLGQGLGKEIGTAAAIGGQMAAGDFSGAMRSGEKALQEEVDRKSQQSMVGGIAEGTLNALPGGQFLNKMFGGFKAKGGSVASDKFYIAGEQGPEVITNTSGRVHPLKGSAGLGGSGRFGAGGPVANKGKVGTSPDDVRKLFDWIKEGVKDASKEGTLDGSKAGTSKGIEAGGADASGAKSKKAGSLYKSMFEGATSSMVDSFMSGAVKGGIKGFGKELASNTKAMLMDALKSALMGGLGKLAGKLKFFGSGGDPAPGEPYIAGETGPELIMPKGRHRVYNPMDTKRMLGGGGTTIVVQEANFSPAPGATGQQSFEAFERYIVDKARRGGSNYFPRTNPIGR